MMEDLEQVYPFPPLTEEEFAELKEDIAERGVQVPIEVDESGKIIDGWHRLQACLELGITDIPFICRDGWTEKQKRTQAIKLNMARRHLTREQKSDLIRETIKETPGKSDRQIANELGVSHPTVGTIRHEMEALGDVEKFTTSTDTLGREQPRQHKPAGETPQAKEDIENPMGAPTPDAQSTAVPECKSKKDAYIPPRTMTPAEDLLMGLKDQAEGLRRVLQLMLDDYTGDKQWEEMLFSAKGIDAALKGLNIIKETIYEFERLTKSRKKQQHE